LPLELQDEIPAVDILFPSFFLKGPFDSADLVLITPHAASECPVTPTSLSCKNSQGVTAAFNHPAQSYDMRQQV
jgi:hypothetical protein